MVTNLLHSPHPLIKTTDKPVPCYKSYKSSYKGSRVKILQFPSLHYEPDAVPVPPCFCYRRNDGGASLLQRLQRPHALIVVEGQRILVLLQRVAPRARARQPAELSQLLVHTAVGLILLLHTPLETLSSLRLLPASVCIKGALIRINECGSLFEHKAKQTF